MGHHVGHGRPRHGVHPGSDVGDEGIDELHGGFSDSVLGPHEFPQGGTHVGQRAGDVSSQGAGEARAITEADGH